MLGSLDSSSLPPHASEPTGPRPKHQQDGFLLRVPPWFAGDHLLLVSAHVSLCKFVSSSLLLTRIPYRSRAQPNDLIPPHSHFKDPISKHSHVLRTGTSACES